MIEHFGRNFVLQRDRDKRATPDFLPAREYFCEQERTEYISSSSRAGYLRLSYLHQILAYVSYITSRQYTEIWSIPVQWKISYDRPIFDDS